MSMMDTMNAGAAPAPQQDPNAQAPGAPPQGGPSPAPDSYGRLGDGGDYQKQSDKIMMLLSGELWQKGLADKINDQMLQQDSDPSAIVGAYTSMLLMGALAAYRSKQQMPEPLVMVDCARQLADQMTDIGLANKTVSPKEADTTAEAGMLIGMGMFLQNVDSSLQPDEKTEYQNILTQIVQNSPDSAKLAQQEAGDAAQLDTAGDADQPNNEGDRPDDGGIPEQQGVMSSAMGAQ